MSYDLPLPNYGEAPSASNSDHFASDVDQGALAKHHTLGNGPTQAAPGSRDYDPYRIALANYTPEILSGATLGNGTITGEYSRTRNVVDAYFEFTLGSTSTITGPSIGITLPVAGLYRLLSSGCDLTDAGTQTFVGRIVTGGTNSFQVWATTTSSSVGAFVAYAAINNMSPMPWAVNDKIAGNVRYRVLN